MKRDAFNGSAVAAARRRVVWSEGMFLRPQHFQQQERAAEQQLRTRLAGLQGHFWGFHELQVDREALAQGRVALVAASGVMPDGTPFAFDVPADGPPALEVGLEVSEQRIVLAVPRQRIGGVEVSFDAPHDADLARYHVQETEAADSNSMGMESERLQVGQLHLRLMPESAVSGDWVSLGVLRVIERRTDHALVLDDRYLPPMLAAERHPRLLGFVKELHTLLDQRSHALSSRLAQPGRGGVGEVADFMLLELVNRYLAVTWHAQQVPVRHPESLYLDWLKLACDLATYTEAERRPTQWPRYQHDALAETFEPLMQQLRRSLSMVLEQNAIQIELQERGNGVSVAQIPSAELLREAGFVLAVSAEMPAEQLRGRFPAQAKLGPVERIRELVLLQLPGVSLRPLPVAPRQIPYSAGHTYFELDKGGELWRQLERSGGLALHLAGEFPGLSIEFWAIRA